MRGLLFVFTCFLIATQTQAQKDIIIQNGAYIISVASNFKRGPIIKISRNDNPEANQQISAELTVFYSAKDPTYVRGRIREGNSPWPHGSQIVKIQRSIYGKPANGAVSLQIE